ncbi:MAG: serine hydrolase [Patescibacteria group bacterium]
MMTRNLKVFFVSFGASLFLWWGMNVLSASLTEFFFLHDLRTNPETLAANAARLNLEQKLRAEYPLAKKGAQRLELQARSVLALYIKEAGATKVLFEKNSETPLPIASITKLMTSLVAVKNYGSEERITITPEILETSGSAGQMRPGDVFTVKDLLYLALMESSNDAAVALTKPLGAQEFVVLMNNEAAYLNLRNTSFVNPTGLDEASQNNSSTAKDLTQLTYYLLENYPQVFDILSQSELTLFTPNRVFHHTMRNTNELLEYYYEWPAKTLGGKTGTTPQARQTLLLVVESPDHAGYIINVILGSEDRLREMRQLLQWILQSYQWHT